MRLADEVSRLFRLKAAQLLTIKSEAAADNSFNQPVRRGSRRDKSGRCTGRWRTICASRREEAHVRSHSSLSLTRFDADH